MRFDVITIFPEIFEPVFNSSMIKRAIDKKLISLNVHNLRDFTNDKYKTVDDKPYGGGVGMILKPEPIVKAVETVKQKDKKTRVLLLKPSKNLFNQEKAIGYAKNYDQIILICGHYEGVDARVEQLAADESLSIGEYVLTGGEVPAMVVIDATARMIPGFFDKEEVTKTESYIKGCEIEHPQYTRPETFRGLKVPKVLLSGNHKKIEMWKRSN